MLKKADILHKKCKKNDQKEYYLFQVLLKNKFFIRFLSVSVTFIRFLLTEFDNPDIRCLKVG